MNYAALQNEVLAYGFSETGYRARVRRWLNEAQHRMARKVQLRELFVDYDLALEGGTATYTLPADFLRVRSVTDPTTNLPLAPANPEWLDTLPVASGLAELYCFVPNGITFYPTPSSTGTLTFRYYRDVPELNVDTDVPVIPEAYHDGLVSYAVSRAYRAEDDPQQAQAFMVDFDRCLMELANDRRYEVADGPRQVPSMWEARHYGGLR